MALMACALFFNKAQAVNTYYWAGLGANSNWTTTGNWQKNVGGAYTGYPGSGTGDIAVISPTLGGTISTVISSSSSTINPISSITIGDNTAVTLTINNSISVSVTGGITIADVLQTVSSSTFTIAGTGTLSISGTSNLYTAGILQVTGNVTFNSGSITNLYGLTGAPLASLQAKIDAQSGGLITASSCTFNFPGTSPVMHASAGTINATSCTFSLSGPIAEAYADGGIFNANSCTFTLGNATSLTAIGANSGTFNINSGTVVNTGINAKVISRLTGTVNLNSGAVINLSGNPSYISNGDNAIFTCGPTSVINLTGTNSSVANTSTNPFTLQSSAAGSATIGTIASGSAGISGTYNVQRFITGGSSTYRNYRLLSCPINMISANAPTSASNLIDLSYLDNNTTVPATTYGAFIGGPGTGFGGGIHVTTNPLMYLYQESITPGTTYNAAFTSGKNVGVKTLTGTSPNYYITTVSTATGGLNSSTVKVPVGNGWIMYYIGDDQRTTLSASTVPNSCTITATGYINQGTIPVYMWGATPTSTLTYTTGTNSRLPGLTMVGNPYPSTLNLYQVYQDNSTSIGSTFYQLSNTNQTFPSYNAASTGASTAGGTQYVVSGQGFYVNVLSTTGTKTLTFKETEKATSTTAPVFPSPILMSAPPNPNVNSNFDAVAVQPKTVQTTAKSQNTAQGVKLPVSNLEGNTPIAPPPSHINLGAPTTPVKNTAPPVNPAWLHLKLMQDSTTYDECGIYFNKGWSDNYDNYDSYYQVGLAPKVYMASFSADNVITGVNALDDYKQGKKVKLYVKAINDGLYNLQLEDLKDIDTALYNVFLVDKQRNDSLDMARYRSYAFNLSVADTSSFSNRFELSITQKSGVQYQLLSFTGQKVSSGIQLNWHTYNAGNYTGFIVQKLNANGTYVTIDTTTSNGNADYAYLDRQPVTGKNTYRLQQNLFNGTISYSSPVTIVYSNTSPNGNLTVYPNPSRNIINISLPSAPAITPNYSADIYNTSGSQVAHETINSDTWTQDISAYKLGVYVIEVKDTNGNLIGKAKFVKVN